ncbi:MAG: hypothetical protein L0332_28515 [Chloroflexi bacterium]|nr:hypothetical protein [Chloroflexota bacterium]MCI0576203.1 hypothetical protein [Chloroflexota bacterium]MCI0645503.1 hypothetical protein [Chloroflexota bacterium]MCI0730642.1 hypothetical protein [Chloroflexota bacterium]
MSRTEWILGGVLALLVLVVAAAVLIFWFFRDQPADAVNNPMNPTAMGAYELAEPLARQWAGDAQFVSARATWQSASGFDPEVASWSFTFYSPAAMATALISVTGDQATLIRSQPASRVLEPGAPEEWVVDSPAAVETLLANGGQSFVDEQGSATLVLALNLNDQPVWTGTFINEQSRRTLQLRLDARNGELLEVIQSE